MTDITNNQDDFDDEFDITGYEIAEADHDDEFDDVIEEDDESAPAAPVATPAPKVKNQAKSLPIDCGGGFPQRNDANRVDALYRQFATQIIKEDAYFCVADKKVYHWHVDGDNQVWKSPDAQTWVLARFPIESGNRKFLNTMVSIFKSLDRIVDNVVYTTNNKNVMTLNLLKDMRVKEVASDEYHPIFDMLMDSLSNHRAPEREWLEKAILFKWRNPGSDKLPAFVMTGVGGSGKSVLGEIVIPMILHSKRQPSVSSSIITAGGSAFNEQLTGRVYCMLNEIVRGNVDNDKLKTFIGSPTLEINGKYKRPIEAKNMILWLIAGNPATPKECSILLAGDGMQTDRRYSVFKCDTTLLDVAKAAQGFETDKEGTAWLQLISDTVLADPTEYGKWLSVLSKRYGEFPCPIAHHGEDYDFYVGSQHSVIADIIDYLFVKRNPRFISLSGAFAIYQAHSKACNIQKTCSRDGFFERMNKALEHKGLTDFETSENERCFTTFHEAIQYEAAANKSEISTKRRKGWVNTKSTAPRYDMTEEFFVADQYVKDGLMDAMVPHSYRVAVNDEPVKDNNTVALMASYIRDSKKTQR